MIGDASYLLETVEGADGITVVIARDSGLNPSEIRRLSWCWAQRADSSWSRPCSMSLVLAFICARSMESP